MGLAYYMAQTQLSNGCTLFVDEWRGVNIRQCCDVHDEAFHYGKNFDEFFIANFELAICFFNAGVWELVIPAFVATCTIGVCFYLWGNKASTPRKP